MNLRRRLGVLPALVFIAACDATVEPSIDEFPRAMVVNTGPKVTAVSSNVGSSGGMCLVRDLRVTFGEPMDPASIDPRRFVLTDEGVPVAGSVSLDATGRTARFVPADPAGFTPRRTIVAAVLSGTGGVRSRAGRPMSEDRVWAFSTGWEPCVGDGIHPPITQSPLPTTERTT